MFYLTYPLRLSAAATQLVIVFYLDSVSTSTLGLYSFYTAFLAIFMQLLQFEGHFLTISGEMERRVVTQVYKVFNIAFSGMCIALYFILGEGVLLAFIYLFILNLSAEWLVNYRTLGDRIAKENAKHVRYMSWKIFIVDIVLPLAVIASFMAGQQNIQSIVLLVAIIISTSVGIGYSFQFKSVRELKIHYLFSVFVKRFDTMLLRIAAGIFFGTDALGRIQPLLSVCRIINILTPTIINMNFLKIIDIANNAREKLVTQLAVSYAAYLCMALVIYFAFTFIDTRDYGFVLVLFAVLYFGNQNSKALLRSVYMASRNTAHANKSLLFLVLAKTAYLPLSGQFDILVLIAVMSLIDLVYIVYLLRSESGPGAMGRGDARQAGSAGPGHPG